MASFWAEHQRDDGDFDCPTEGCGRVLKVRVSNTAKNPNRQFVSCAKDFGGCGLFCFTDERPKFGGGKSAQKRARPGGNGYSGQLAVVETPEAARIPSDVEVQLARLATAVDRVEQELRAVKTLLEKQQTK